MKFKVFSRLLIGVSLLPACWAAALVLWDSIILAAGAVGGFTVEAMSLLGGIVAFTFCWMALSHPVKTYVLGHELTHAMWAIMFGAKASDVRVSEKGGSVKLSKTNIFITLAPYFFPFYTFIVIIAGLITYAFVRPLPCLALWMFLVGFTWAFHALFTIETLMQRQPDVKAYGRLFSWTFIFLANILIVLLWLWATTPMSFASLSASVAYRLTGAYTALFSSIVSFFKFIGGLCSQI